MERQETDGGTLIRRAVGNLNRLPGSRDAGQASAYYRRGVPGCALAPKLSHPVPRRAPLVPEPATSTQCKPQALIHYSRDQEPTRYTVTRLRQ